MSKSKTFEAPTIEEALVAAAQEFGPGVEVADAQKRRRGGLFGFFAKEYFEVTAVGAETGTPPAEEQRSDESDFGQVLQQMADEVADTVEITHGSAPAATAVGGEEAAAVVGQPARPLPRRHRPETVSPQALADRAVGLIDLRQGRRIPVDPLVATDASGGAVRERPSQLRRRLTAGPTEPGGANPLTREVTGPVLDLRDRTPHWSIDRLRQLGLGERMLEMVAAFEPDTDLEWVQALAIAIQVQIPDRVSAGDTLLAGDGRASAVGLLHALADGQVPAFLLVDGQKIPATANELALSIRECLR